MPWSETVPYADATGRPKTLYDRVKGLGNAVDNVMAMHALRPHSMEGHLALYKAALHHSGNTLPGWLLETLGMWVSALNRCDYCVQHHLAGLRRLLKADARADAMRRAIEARDPEAAPLTDAQKQAMRYAEKLTLTPSAVSESDVGALRDAGLAGGEILEINQVTAYFAHANRTALGLGCSTDGDVLGLSPGDPDDPGNWTHSQHGEGARKLTVPVQAAC